MAYNSLKELFVGICDAIRGKDGTSASINHQDIPARITALAAKLHSKSVDPTETGSTVTPGSGYDGLSSVTVNPISKTYVGSGVTRKGAEEFMPSDTDQTISSGQYLTGTQIIKGDSDLLAKNIKSGVTIFDVPGSYTGEAIDLQTLSAITPTKSKQTFNVDSGKDGFASPVVVNAIPSNYVDTSSGDASASHILSGKKAWVDAVEVTGNIPTKTSDNVTVNGASVKVPPGYYASEVNKSVSTTTQASPTISIDESTGKVTVTASVSQGTGYVTGGTKTAELELSTQSATTITPGASSKPAVAKGVYTTGAVTVAGDSDLKASNIKKDITIFDVTGTYEGEAPVLQTKPAVTPTKSSQTVTYDSGYDGLNTVTVNAIPSKYVDTTISSDGATASTMLSGKKAYVNGSLVTGNIATVSKATPSISVSSSGLITASVSQSNGYVSGDNKSATKQLTTKGTTTITPTTSSQTAVNSGVYTTGVITVAAIPSKYTDTSSMTSIESGVILTSDPYGSTQITYDSDEFIVTHEFGNDYIIRDGASIELRIDLSVFGDATRDEVLSGATFTSSAGFCKTGTASMTSGGDYSAGDVVQAAASTTENFYFVSGYSSIYVRYCDKSNLSASSGSVKMNSYSTINISSTTDCSVLKGKCIQAEITSSGGYSDVFYVSPSSSFTVSTSGSKYLRVMTAYPMFVIA